MGNNKIGFWTLGPQKKLVTQKMATGILQTNCDSPENAASRTHCRFQLVHSSLQCHSSRDSSDRRHMWYIRNLFTCLSKSQCCCLQPSFRKLTVCLLTFSASAVVVVLSIFALVNNLLRGFSQLRLLCLAILRVLVLLNRLLHLLLFLCCCSSSDFLTVCTWPFTLAAFCSSVAFPRHLLYRNFFAPT